MYEIRKISPFIIARIAGLAGILASVIPSLLWLLADMNVFKRYRAFDYDVETIIVAIVIPLAIGVALYIVTAVAVLLYNVAVPYIGGFKVELDFIPEEDEDQPGA